MGQWHCISRQSLNPGKQHLHARPVAAKNGWEFQTKRKMVGVSREILRLGLYLSSVFWKIPYCLAGKNGHILPSWVKYFFHQPHMFWKKCLEGLVTSAPPDPWLPRFTLKSWSSLGNPGPPNVACLCVGFHHSWCRRGSSTSTGKIIMEETLKKWKCKSPTFFHNLTWCLVGSMDLVEPFLECLKSNSNQCGGSFPSLMGAHGCRNDALKRSPPPKVKSHGPGFILIIYETRWFPIATWKVLKFSKQKWQENEERQKHLGCQRSSRRFPTWLPAGWMAAWHRSHNLANHSKWRTWRSKLHLEMFHTAPSSPGNSQIPEIQFGF